MAAEQPNNNDTLQLDLNEVNLFANQHYKLILRVDDQCSLIVHCFNPDADLHFNKFLTILNNKLRILYAKDAALKDDLNRHDGSGYCFPLKSKEFDYYKTVFIALELFLHMRGFSFHAMRVMASIYQESAHERSGVLQSVGDRMATFSRMNDTPCPFSGSLLVNCHAIGMGYGEKKLSPQLGIVFDCRELKAHETKELEEQYLLSSLSAVGMTNELYSLYQVASEKIPQFLTSSEKRIYRPGFFNLPESSGEEGKVLLLIFEKDFLPELDLMAVSSMVLMSLVSFDLINKEDYQRCLQDLRTEANLDVARPPSLGSMQKT